MNNAVLNGINKNNVTLGADFFTSQKRNQFKSMFDVKSKNTIILVNLDRATVNESSEFAEYIEKTINDGKSKIIIDLENVYFMDSIFLGTLIKYLKRVSKMNGYIKLIVDHKSKPELLSLSTFEGIFEIYPNLFDALNSTIS
ncbi:MAG: STAS domain-containing protein [Ignavibacteriae bacterium]|nr:STAS domain-containing protein [Ignavibacteriota bacterium]